MLQHRPSWRITSKILGTSKLPVRHHSRFSPVPILDNPSIPSFRETYFNPAKPVIFPHGHFQKHLPAIKRWFSPPNDEIRVPSLNIDYLHRFGDTLIPLELTRTVSNPEGSNISPGDGVISGDIEFE
ncbi:hypothetical protein LTS18_008941, partial [Coniosporium uncinatum]